MTLPFVNDLSNYNTTNATRSVVCWPARPCYRFTSCKYCQSRKRKLIIEQVQHFTFVWDLKFFVTATLLNYRGPESSAVETLQHVRRVLIRRFFKGRKYIVFLAVEYNSDLKGFVVPHFHFLTDGSVTSFELMKAFGKLSEQHAWKIQIKKIDKTYKGVRNLAGYLIDQNYFKTLPFQKKGVRLITGSKGFRAGKGRNEVHRFHSRRSLQGSEAC